MQPCTVPGILHEFPCLIFMMALRYHYIYFTGREIEAQWPSQDVDLGYLLPLKPTVRECIVRGGVIPWGKDGSQSSAPRVPGTHCPRWAECLPAAAGKVWRRWRRLC